MKTPDITAAIVLASLLLPLRPSHATEKSGSSPDWQGGEWEDRGAQLRQWIFETELHGKILNMEILDVNGVHKYKAWRGRVWPSVTKTGVVCPPIRFSLEMSADGTVVYMARGVDTTRVGDRETPELVMRETSKDDEVSFLLDNPDCRLRVTIGRD